jgi:magnesium chelatase subunit I
VAEVWRGRLGGLDLSGFVTAAAGGEGVTSGDRIASGALLEQVGTMPGLAAVLTRLGFAEIPTPAQAASAVEFVLEGLHLTRRLAKDVLADGRTRYGGEGEEWEGGRRP